MTVVQSFDEDGRTYGRKFGVSWDSPRVSNELAYRLARHVTWNVPDVHFEGTIGSKQTGDTAEDSSDWINHLGFHWYRTTTACETREKLDAEFSERQEAVVKFFTEYVDHRTIHG